MNFKFKIIKIISTNYSPVTIQRVCDEYGKNNVDEALNFIRKTYPSSINPRYKETCLQINITSNLIEYNAISEIVKEYQSDPLLSKGNLLGQNIGFMNYRINHPFKLLYKSPFIYSEVLKIIPESFGKKLTKILLAIIGFLGTVLGIIVGIIKILNLG